MVLPSHRGSPWTPCFSFWHLAIFSFEFHYGLKTSMCLQPKWGPPVPARLTAQPRSPRRVLFHSVDRILAHPKSREAAMCSLVKCQLSCLGRRSIITLTSNLRALFAFYVTILFLMSSGFSVVISINTKTVKMSSDTLNMLAKLSHIQERLRTSVLFSLPC